MATHFSILAWEIPWTEEPGGLQCMRSQEYDITKWTKPPPPPALLHIWDQIAECVWREIPNYARVQFSSVQFICSVMCNSLRHHGLQHTRLPCPSPTPGAYSNSCPLSWWCHLTISSSVIPFSSCLQTFLASVYFTVNQFFMPKVLDLQLQHQSFQWTFKVDFLLDGLVWSCSPRDSQESSPAPQFERINSLALSLLYGPSLTSLHDYWKDHSFDYTDLCQQSDVSAF